MMYKVEWLIDIDADTPEEAVAKARECQLDPESTATSFQVTDCETGECTTIDLINDVEWEEEEVELEKAFPNSSQVERMKYSPNRKVLTVTFNNGSVYNYLEVPDLIWEGCITTDSIGRYLNQEIKKFYQCERID